MLVVIQAIRWLCNIIIYMMLGRAILSWFVNPYNANPNGFMYKLYAFLTQVTEPIVRPFRNFLSRFNTGPVDFSLFLAIIALGVIQQIVIRILYFFV